MARAKNQSILFGDSLRSAIQSLQPLLSKPDQDKIEQLLALSTAEQIPLATAIQALFPDKDQPAGLKLTTNFKGRINGIAEEANHPVRFVIDNKKRDTPATRRCWFTGPNPTAARAIKFAQQLTADLEGQPEVQSKGVVSSSSAMAAGKRVVRFFVSYAHENDKGRAALAESLLKELRTQFMASMKYELDLWVDKRIMLEEKWHDRIQLAIEECQFGLFLVSPAFLGSDYIKQNEIPPFVKDDPTCKPVIPVGLVRVDWNKHDLKGLQHRQFYLGSHPPNEQFYDDIAAGRNRRDFVHGLYLKIEDRLDAHFDPGDPPSGKPAPAPPQPEPLTEDEPDSHCRNEASKELHRQAKEIPETKDFQPTRGFPVSLADLELLAARKLNPTDAKDALPEIQRWACDSAAAPMFALLGEYGIGKTTTLKQLTRLMIKEREDNPSLPLPIYIDLRDFVEKDTQSKESVPTIEQLLGTVIDRSWKLDDRSITPADILQLVREEGAVIFFDGLDEKIVHMNQDRGRAFIKTLWSTIPDSNRRAKEGVRRGKILISCRSHYFKDIGSQNSMLSGQEREQIDKSNFPTFCLLPFTEEQIQNYLISFYRHDDPVDAHARQRATEAFDLIRSIHNLRDLAERPYLLAQIIQHLGELEQLAQRGESVNAARLYELFIKSWLHRDDGKHQIDPEHKRLLMEELARELWISEEKQWDAPQLEQWLDRFLLAHPEIGSAYANKDRMVLKEDLRTATFVLRPDTEDKLFRFAHTSLQEFFLASRLHRALLEDQLEAWDLPLPSIETLDFLGQLLVLNPKPRTLEALNAVLARGGDASRTAFRYWLRARELGYPVPQPKQVNLAGADLDEWPIHGASDRPLDLRGANLAGAQLNRCRLEHVLLSHANLTGAECRQALFQNVQADHADLRGADLSGLKWRGGSLAHALLADPQPSSPAASSPLPPGEGPGVRVPPLPTPAPTDARLHGVELLHLDLTGTTLPAAWTHFAASFAARGTPPETLPNSLQRQLNTGHSGAVLSVAWNREGTRLASGSSDNTVKVWDAQSGACLLTASGHTGSVNSVAWDREGTRLASGSNDNTVKVWDAQTGACLLTATGHCRSVTSVAWNREGTRLASGSYDCTVQVWDVQSRDRVLTVIRDIDAVLSVAWNREGTRLASGSEDKTVKVWDAHSGVCLLTATGHTNAVTSVAWNREGTRLASGSHDKTVKVWDSQSGTCLLTTSGHWGSVNSVAWNRQGTQLASGSAHNTVKVWDAHSGACLLTTTGHSAPVASVAWNREGTRLASGSYDCTVRVRDAQSGTCLLTVSGHMGAVLGVAWNREGSQLASGSDDQTVKVWDPQSGDCMLTARGHTRRVICLAWNRKGTQLASSSLDKTVKVWDAQTGACQLTLHTGLVIGVAWNREGTQIASGSLDKTVQVWDVQSGDCRFTAHGHRNYVLSVAWNREGTQLASGSSDNTVKVWDALSGACLLTAIGHSRYVSSVTWNRDGTQLASGSGDNSVKVWDAQTGACLLTATGHIGSVRSVAWNREGTRLASASEDKTVRVWDAHTGACLLTARGHTGTVMSVAWNREGTRLTSGSDDQTVKVWDAQTGACLRTITNLPEDQSICEDEHGTLLNASPEAWRFVGWRYTDPRTHQLRLLPAEAHPLWPKVAGLSESSGTT